MRNRVTLIASTLICFWSAIPAWAQIKPEPKPEKSYVLSYFIVGLGIALGLVAVCRPSKRSKNIRRPE